jgi:hypothetical protein
MLKKEITEKTQIAGCRSIVLLPLLLSQQEVHDPTAANMRAFAAAVPQNLCVVATGFFKDFGQSRHAIECPLIVNSLSESDRSG